MQPELQPRTTYPIAGELGLQQQRVLRNTYLLLAITMVPTVIGAPLSTSAFPYASSSSVSLPLNAAATMPTERLARTSAPAIESSR